MDHTVTYENTRKHWTLYTLDAWEESNHPEGREDGAQASGIYEHAGGSDSIVFNSRQEVSSLLSELARETSALHRKAQATEWGGPDVIFDYRLSGSGREVLIDLGAPSRLPNREDMDDDDRELPVKPAHRPGWWKKDWELSDERFEDSEDWVSTDHPRVYYRSEGDQFDRGEVQITTDLAEAFPECTFVITMGPWRMHDISYAIRDPFDRTIQIDVYSAGLIVGERNWEQHISELSRDLHEGLQANG